MSKYAEVLVGYAREHWSTLPSGAHEAIYAGAAALRAQSGPIADDCTRCGHARTSHTSTVGTCGVVDCTCSAFLTHATQNVTSEAVRDILNDYTAEADTFSRTVERLRELVAPGGDEALREAATILMLAAGELPCVLRDDAVDADVEVRCNVIATVHEARLKVREALAALEAQEGTKL